MLVDGYLQMAVVKLVTNRCFIAFDEIFKISFVDRLTLVWNFTRLIGWNEAWSRWFDDWNWCLVANARQWRFADGFLRNQLYLLRCLLLISLHQLWSLLCRRNGRNACGWLFFHVWGSFNKACSEGIWLLSHTDIFSKLLETRDWFILFLKFRGLSLHSLTEVKGLVIERTLGFELLFFVVVIVTDIGVGGELPKVIKLCWFPLVLNVGSSRPNVAFLEQWYLTVWTVLAFDIVVVLWRTLCWGIRTGLRLTLRRGQDWVQQVWGGRVARFLWGFDLSSCGRRVFILLGSLSSLERILATCRVTLNMDLICLGLNDIGLLGLFFTLELTGILLDCAQNIVCLVEISGLINGERSLVFLLLLLLLFGQVEPIYNLLMSKNVRFWVTRFHSDRYPDLRCRLSSWKTRQSLHNDQGRCSIGGIFVFLGFIIRKASTVFRFNILISFAFYLFASY